MFGIPQKKLLENLEKIRKALCCYMGDTCDCKYGPVLAMGGWDQKRTHENTGCPEIRCALELINAMTPKEFAKIAQRARLIICRPRHRREGRKHVRLSTE